MIEAQNHTYSRTTSGPDWHGENIVELGGHLLKAAGEFDQLLMQGISAKSALGILKEQPAEYCSEVLAALGEIKIEPASRTARSVMVKELDTTMVLGDDIRSSSGMLLASKGQEISIPLLHRLRAAAKSVGVVEPISVTIDRPGM
jgi:hypothetical protein